MIIVLIPLVTISILTYIVLNTKKKIESEKENILALQKHLSNKVKENWKILINASSALEAYTEKSYEDLNEIIESRSNQPIENIEDIEFSENSFVKAYKLFKNISSKNNELRDNLIYLKRVNIIDNNNKEIEKIKNSYNIKVKNYNESLNEIPFKIVANIFSYDNMEYIKYNKLTEERINLTA